MSLKKIILSNQQGDLKKISRKKKEEKLLGGFLKFF